MPCCIFSIVWVEESCMIPSNNQITDRGSTGYQMVCQLTTPPNVKNERGNQTCIFQSKPERMARKIEPYIKNLAGKSLSIADIGVVI